LARLDEHAFARLYEESYRTLWCVAAAALNDRAGADDVCQEAAIVALRKLDSFAVGTNFSAWMSQIVRLVARNASRKAARRRGASLDAVGDIEMSEGPGASFDIDSGGRLTDDQAAFDDDVVQALEGLDETARTCLLLRTVLGKAYSDIARILEIPEGTAMSHVHRSRRRLREALSARSCA
jgi:RNA polymerase sigma-70 factor (ECF subfamily)